MVARRTFLGLVLMPVVLPSGGARVQSAAPVASERQQAAESTDALDPQVARLRAIEIDESVEPALVFRPASG